MSEEWCTQTVANVLALKTPGEMSAEQVKETTLTYRLNTKQSIISYANGCVSVSVRTLAHHSYRVMSCAERSTPQMTRLFPRISEVNDKRFHQGFRDMWS